MKNIYFTPGRYDGQLWTTDDNPNLRHLVYVDVKSEAVSTLSGWVTPEVRRLVLAAPANQRKVYDYERLIGDLLERLNADDLDGTRDLVKAEYDAIHGSAD